MNLSLILTSLPLEVASNQKGCLLITRLSRLGSFPALQLFGTEKLGHFDVETAIRRIRVRFSTVAGLWEEQSPH